LMVICCESFDYVYVDNYTFQKQLSNINNGFVAVVLQIDPTKENTNMTYVVPGQIIREKVSEKKTSVSSELIQLILEVINRNQKDTSNRWYPTYKIFIKYSDRFLYIIPFKKYISVIFDFKNSIVFIEGRAFVFNEKETELLKAKLDYLLNNPSP